MKKQKQINWRLNSVDQKVFSELKEKLRVQDNAKILRKSVYEFAQKKGIELPPGALLSV